MSLRLVFHGGKCCAIKTIYGFSMSPGTETYKCMETEKHSKRTQDKCGNHVNSDMDFFTDEAPMESYEARLDRLIEFCRRDRPAGVIEAVLMQHQDYGKGEAKSGFWPPKEGSGQMPWEPELIKRGFVKVSGPIFNSNSQNYVNIYHLVYNDIGKVKEQEKEAAATRTGNFLAQQVATPCDEFEVEG